MNARALSYLIAFSLTLGATFLYVKTKDSAQPPASSPEVAAASPAVTYKLEVIDGVLQSAPLRIQTTIGEPVLLEVTVDETDEIHVHGIDKTYRLDVGKANQVRLVSDQTGSFELELHDHPVVLGVLEVYPR